MYEIQNSNYCYSFKKFKIIRYIINPNRIVLSLIFTIEFIRENNLGGFHLAIAKIII